MGGPEGRGRAKKGPGSNCSTHIGDWIYRPRATALQGPCCCTGGHLSIVCGMGAAMLFNALGGQHSQSFNAKPQEDLFRIRLRQGASDSARPGVTRFGLCCSVRVSVRPVLRHMRWANEPCFQPCWCDDLIIRCLRLGHVESCDVASMCPCRQ